jgi:hypothetical protein
MTLTLIPRSSRSLAEHINAIYRTFKGLDPDSLWVRLASGGSFEVRHSVTNAPVLAVSDAGVTSLLLPAGAIGSSQIADGSLMDIDVNSAAGIQGSKLATGVNGVTSLQIAPNTIATGNMAASSITQRVADQTGTTTPTTNGPTAAGPFADPTATVPLATGGDILVWATMGFNDATGGALISLHVRVDGGGFVPIADSSQPSSAGRWFLSGFHVFTGLGPGNHLIELGRASNANFITYFPASRRLLPLGVYR